MSRSISPQVVRPARVRLARLVATAALAVAPLSCGDRDAVRVQLQAYSPPGFDVRRMEIRAQVAGPVAGLRYMLLRTHEWTDDVIDAVRRDLEHPGLEDDTMVRKLSRELK